MRDMHCHILPGVDDGSPDMSTSLKMFAAAKAAGVTSMVCTPHCRNPYFDFKAMHAACKAFKAEVAQLDPNFPVYMGFEVAYPKLVQLGVEKWAPYLAFEQSNEFLLELEPKCTRGTFEDYERVIFQLQGMGFEVIIAHPERYEAIQKDTSIAEDLRRMGCKLQASADFIAGGRLGREKRPAKKLFKQGLYNYIASDAHNVKHYTYLEKAIRKFG
ncbi:MAG: CpsB/CapC family capsule biosynthesis tyrosine phosphatase [Atopobiaceae bacterium]|jgi:protein-tyrosine phosphatase